MEFTDKEKTLIPGINSKVQELKINKTYFYQMPSGNIEAVEAREAWNIHKKCKQIGVSDGTRYSLALKESQQIMKSEGLEAAQERLRQGFREELEAATGNFETPPACDVFGNGAVEFMNMKGNFR